MIPSISVVRPRRWAALALLFGGMYGGFLQSHPTRTATASVPALTGACGLSAPAFCDTFAEGPSAGGRSGDLDRSNWSVARIVPPYQYMGGGDGAGSYSEFPPVPVTPCHGSATVWPDTETLICPNGTLMTATQGQNYGLLSYRPLVPFDFSGRTGKIVFDVDATTGGGGQVDLSLRHRPAAEWRQ
jgi:hypothetical protein